MLRVGDMVTHKSPTNPRNFWKQNNTGLVLKIEPTDHWQVEDFRVLVYWAEGQEKTWEPTKWLVVTSEA